MRESCRKPMLIRGVVLAAAPMSQAAWAGGDFDQDQVVVRTVPGGDVNVVNQRRSS